MSDSNGALAARFQAPVQAMLRQLAAEQVVRRIWAGDPSLWHPSAETQRIIAQRLGWLALAEQSVPEPVSLDALPANCQWASCGPCAPHVRLWLAATGRRSDVRLRDTVAPEIFDAAEADVTPAVVVGGDLSPELEALGELLAGSGCPLSGLTAHGSEVDAWLGARCAPALHAVPPGVTERWGLLSAYGWAPALHAGADVGPLLAAAAAMGERCRSKDELEGNPGLYLGAVLGVMAQHGRDKLVLLAPLELAPLVEWIALFVGGSIAKHRRGFVPVVAEPEAPLEQYGADHVFVVLDNGSADDALRRRAAALAAAGQPVLSYALPDPAAWIAHAVCWQVGVAVAAVVIGLNPFDEPDAVALRTALRRALSAGPQVTAAALQLPDPRVAVAWRDALELRNLSFVALALYWAPSQAERVALADLRGALRARGLASMVVEPLRDPLAATQLLHAGRADGLVVALSRADLTTTPASSPLAGLAAARLALDLGAWRRAERALLHADVGPRSAAALAVFGEIVAAVD